MKKKLKLLLGAFFNEILFIELQKLFILVKIFKIKNQGKI